MQRTRYKQLGADVANIAVTPVVIDDISQQILSPGAYDFDFQLFCVNSDATNNSCGINLAYSGTGASISLFSMNSTPTVSLSTLNPVIGQRYAVPASSTGTRGMRVQGRIIVLSAGLLTVALDRLTSGTLTCLAASNSSLTQVA